MNLKTLSFTTLTLAAAMLPAEAFFRAAFRIDKSYRQISSDTPAFTGGEGYLYLVDGTSTETGCNFNGSINPFGIDTEEGCNIGSNAVAFFGTAVAPYFYELVGVETATIVEPGRRELVSLYARPSFDFPLNNLNIESNTTVIFYDLLSETGDVSEYRLAGAGFAGSNFLPGYSFKRIYGPADRSRMEREIKTGNYQFKFPALGRPNIPLYLNFPVLPTVEGYTDDSIRQGFRFVNVGPWSTEGFAEYDRNVISEFRWEGLTPSGVASTDRLYVGFRRPNDDGDPNSGFEVNAFDEPIYDFPPPGANVNLFPGTRIRVPSPLQNFYNLPPGFFTLNQRTILQVTLERDPKIGLGAVSYRNFELPIVFVDGFPGSMAVAFPKDTPAAMMTKEADPDGDGVSNWLEWLSGTDPYTANAPASLSQLAYVPASTRRSGQTIPGYWHMSIDRRAGLPSAVSVVVESSTDLETWTPVAKDDPHWIIEDYREEPRIRILSRTPELTDKRYFRVKYNDPG